MRSARLDRQHVAVVAVFLLAVLAAWMGVSRLEIIDPLILPDLGAVTIRLVEMSTTAALWESLAVTTLRILAAFAIAMVAGLLIGVPIGRSRGTSLAYTPLLANLSAVPLFALYPVLLLVFGIGDASKIAFGTLNGFFPIVLAAIAGASAVPNNLMLAARAMGASRLQQLVTVIIPGALAEILAGLRLGLALCTLAVFGGEILGSTAGLGYRLAVASETYLSVDVYAYVLTALILTAVLSIALSLIIRSISRK
ncbi:taurine ABC transporter permease TauC [Microbacterium kribbense]|uniref:Taurine ABC transporter permease TauC n=1 Tax=Microbacterium kribbense TaxID=433645 RepID=A0ABP7GJC3_9MICO